MVAQDYHPNKSMRRGIQQSKARKQRVARLNWIAESSNQAKEQKQYEYQKKNPTTR
jgi:hypothetical protein